MSGAGKPDKASDSFIHEQLAVIDENLRRCRSAVESEKIDQRLRGRVGARFDTEVTRLAEALAALRSKLQAGEPNSACWLDLDDLQRHVDKVFSECLAFLQGALAREAGLDDQICSLTDDLLDDLAGYSDVPWGRFTLLATSELYLDTAEIIRIRYPEVSLWAMPLAAHEFGHYVGPRLRQDQDGDVSYPLQALLKNLDAGRVPPLHTMDWYHVQEHFSDLFATYTMGPAYVAAFMSLRMNAGKALHGKLTHPSGARRVHGILWALDKMREGETRPGYHSSSKNIASQLRTVWQANLRQAGAPEHLADAEASLINQRMSQLFSLLAGTTPLRLRYQEKDLSRAIEIAACLLENTAMKDLPAGLTRRDVLNGAWLARLDSADRSPYAFSRFATLALEAYRRLSPHVNQGNHK